MTYHKNQYEQVKQEPCVFVGNSIVPVRRVKVLNVENDNGRDLLTFVWSGEKRQSYIILKVVSPPV